MNNSDQITMLIGVPSGIHLQNEIDYFMKKYNGKHHTEPKVFEVRSYSVVYKVIIYRK